MNKFNKLLIKNLNNNNNTKNKLLLNKRFLSTNNNNLLTSVNDNKSYLAAGLGLSTLLIAGITATNNGNNHHNTTHNDEKKEETTTKPSNNDKINELLTKFNQKIDLLEKKVIINNALAKNRAFVFIKPHACNDKVDELIKKTFKFRGITVTGEGDLDYKKIDEGMLIDTHYGAIAQKAVILDPSELAIPEKGLKQFKEMFGVEFSDVLKEKKAYNAKQAMEKLNVDGDGLEKLWRDQLKKNVNLIKFGGGFYCGKLIVNDEEMFVFNGFYPQMRSKYTKEPAKIHYYTIEFDPRTLSWEEFRNEVLGTTDPTEAVDGSLRRVIYENFELLDLPAKPDTGDNGVHASASPFEASAERVNWLSYDSYEDDQYLAGVIASGVPEDKLKSWLGDAQVKYEGKKQSIFDILEDKDSKEVLEILKNVVKEN